MPQTLGGGEKCPRCDKTVYFAEERRALGRKYHIACLKCVDCSKSLDSTNSNDHDREIYCNACYRKQFGPQGYGFAAGSAGLSCDAGHGGESAPHSTTPSSGPGSLGGGEQCPRCQRAVYMAEKIIGAGRVSTREKAYVYGIAAAAMVHTIARACSIGVTTKCSCGVLPNTPPSGTFKWGGCGDDLHFGTYFTQKFTDATLRSKTGKVKKSTKAMMDEHNFAAGRHVAQNSLVTSCKCHGVSGSCSIKTCWKALPDFDLIGAALKERYALAVEVKRRKRKKAHVLLPIQPGRDSFSRDELIYYAKSPDYCYPDEKTGSVGTRGRLCDPMAVGPGNCGPMCCGRGADNFTMEVVERCECKYYWCCYVKCKACTRVLNLSKCR